MRLLSLIIVTLISFLGASLAQTRLPNYGPGVILSPPPQAAVVGYNTLTFNTEVFSTANVDNSATYAPGFKWYLRNWFGNTSTSIAFSGGAAVIDASSITTVGINGSTWHGKAFGGGGYFEATFSFSPTLVTNTPIFWGMSVEHVDPSGVDHWPGQASTYEHFSEADFVEYFPTNALYRYHVNLRDWYGIFGTTCGAGIYCNVDPSFDLYTNSQIVINFAKPHTYGFLWVPATMSTMGSATWYMDNVAMQTQTWSLYAAPPDSPPPTAQPWLFGIIDQQHMGIVLEQQGATGRPVTLTSVRVWQLSNAGNVSQ